MSLDRVHLRKLLCWFYADRAQRIRMLREDIRLQLSKEAGMSPAGGGDFYAPFWADARDHVIGQADLHDRVESRIELNPRRARLYPLLRDGFLRWWNVKRRWRNDDFTLVSESVHGRFQILNLGEVKVESVLAVDLGAGSYRIAYPYFSEEPALPEEGARLGLWLLSQALPHYRTEHLRMLDVLRGNSYGEVDVPLRGDEAELFASKYQALQEEWVKLRSEYR